MYGDNNKSQASVATHLRCGGLASLQSNYCSVCPADCVLRVCPKHMPGPPLLPPLETSVSQAS